MPIRPFVANSYKFYLLSTLRTPCPLASGMLVKFQRLQFRRMQRIHESVNEDGEDCVPLKSVVPYSKLDRIFF
jgi:hypothetical protein